MSAKADRGTTTGACRERPPVVEAIESLHGFLLDQAEKMRLLDQEEDTANKRLKEIEGEMKAIEKATRQATAELILEVIGNDPRGEVDDREWYESALRSPIFKVRSGDRLFGVLRSGDADKPEDFRMSPTDPKLKEAFGLVVVDVGSGDEAGDESPALSAIGADGPARGEEDEEDEEDLPGASEFAREILVALVGHHKSLIDLIARLEATSSADEYKDDTGRDWDRWSDVLCEAKHAAARALGYAVAATNNRIVLRTLRDPRMPQPIASVDLQEHGLVMVRPDPSSTSPKGVEIIYAPLPAIGDQICVY